MNIQKHTVACDNLATAQLCINEPKHPQFLQNGVNTAILFYARGGKLSMFVVRESYLRIHLISDGGPVHLS